MSRVDIPDTSASPSFGHLVKQLRLARDLTQDALAQRLARSSVFVSLIESDQRRPTRDLLPRLISALELTPDEGQRLAQAAGYPAAAASSTPPTDESPSFGATLRRLREARHLSQEALGDQLARSNSFVSLIESDRRRPTRDLLPQVRAALELTPEEDHQLARAGGFPVDELESAVQQVVAIIAAQVPVDAADRALLSADLTATATGWRDLLLGSQDVHRGMLARARDHYERMTEHTEYSPTLIAYTRAQLAESLEKLGELRRAEDHGQTSRTVIERMPTTWASTLRAKIMGIQSTIAMRQGLYPVAASLIERGKRIFNAMRDAGDRAIAQEGLGLSHKRLALLALLQGEPDAALRHCEDAADYLRQAGYADTHRWFLRIDEFRAWAFSLQGKPDDARELHTRCLRAYERMGDAYGAAKVWLYLGDDDRRDIEGQIERQGIYEEYASDVRREKLRAALEPMRALLDNAARAYQTALAGLRSAGDQILLGRCWRSLGDIARLAAALDGDAQSYRTAEEYLVDALDLDSRIGQERSIPTIYESMAKLDWDRGALTSTRHHFNSALNVLNSAVIGHAADSAGEQLRQRIQRAMHILGEHPGADEPPPPDDSVGQLATDTRPSIAFNWRQASHKLIETLSEYVVSRHIPVTSTSDLTQEWIELLCAIEKQEGPRWLAQNRFSNALLSSSLPPGFPTELGTFHQARHAAFEANVRKAHEHAGEHAYHDLCCRDTIARGPYTPPMRALVNQQAAQALDLLRRFKLGYTFDAGIHELPLAFLVKGDACLLEIPPNLVSRFTTTETRSDYQDKPLCFYLPDVPVLAQTLVEMFDEFVSLARQSTQLRDPIERQSTQLRDPIERQTTQLRDPIERWLRDQSVVETGARLLTTGAL